jgi:8-oxo-dGTP pyrophosphatase MutT (NUDIX family)
MKKGEDFTGISIIYFCHDGAGNFLFNRRSNNCRDERGNWDCGGGGLEFGDSIEDTLKKELKEEYGADVVKYDFLGYRDVHREHDGKKTHWVALDFKVQVDPEKVKNGEPHKFEEIGWFKLDSLPQPLHSQIPNALKIYKDKLLNS